jgi:signal transduction histidine kinase
MYQIKVLAVDDEENMRSGMFRVLSRHKIILPDIESEVTLEVKTTDSAEKALEILKDYPADLLILDYKMSGMSGLDMLELLDKETKMLTIMITAYASLDTAVSAIRAGAFDFLAKPFSPKELKDTVGKAVHHLILAKQVRKLNEEKRQVRFQFISVLGHELKAPLNAIEGYLYMIKDRTAGEELKPYDEMVNRSILRTDQMRKLIQDILEMTKIESGKRKRVLQDIDIIPIVLRSIETMLPDAEKMKVAMNLNAKSTVIFRSDSEEIEMILNNLISNAVKYNKPGGKVDINVELENEKLIISVKDSGIGMTNDESSQLFNEFVRIKNSKTRNILGSGLGLSTVKKIAELYGGNVEVQSQADIGTEIKVLLNKDNS